MVHVRLWYAMVVLDGDGLFWLWQPMVHVRLRYAKIERMDGTLQL